MKTNISALLKDMSFESSTVSLVVSNSTALVRYDIGKYTTDLHNDGNIDIEKMLLLVVEKMYWAWQKDKDPYSKDFRKGILPKLKDLCIKYHINLDKV